MSELLIEEWNPIYNILNDNDFFYLFIKNMLSTFTLYSVKTNPECLIIQ